MKTNAKLSITGYNQNSIDLFNKLGKKLGEINQTDVTARSKSLRPFLGKSANKLTQGFLVLMQKSDDVAKSADLEIQEAIHDMVKKERPRLEALGDQSSLEALSALVKDLSLEYAETKIPVLKATGKPFTISDAQDYDSSIRVLRNVYQEAMTAISKHQAEIISETNEQITGAVAHIVDIKRKSYQAQADLLKAAIKALAKNADSADEMAKALTSVADETSTQASKKVKVISSDIADDSKKLDIEMG